MPSGAWNPQPRTRNAELKTSQMIAAVILASGFSRRMGRSKLTLKIGGRTLLQRALDAVLSARGIDRCLVVLRPEDVSQVPRVESRVEGGRSDSRLETRDSKLRLEVLENPLAAEGQSAGVRLGAERLAADAECEAAILSVVDQPFLGPKVFEALIEGWRAEQGEILVSTYAGQRGNPVLFARRFFPELAQLEGDVGGREVVRTHPEAVGEVAMPDPRAGWDVDTWADFLAAQQEFTR